MECKVRNYILGEDIPNSEELENDAVFMLEVLKISKDHKMFVFCSETLKNDYNFIQSVVEIFVDNPAFIENLIKEYEKSNKESLDVKELKMWALNNVKLSNITRTSYRLSILALMEFEMLIHSVMSKTYKDELKYNQGGFYLGLERFVSYPNLLNEMVVKIIGNFLNENDIEFLIHQKFKSKEELLEAGLNSFAIDCIWRYDELLSSHVSVNLDYLKPILEVINKAIKEWDKYDDKVYLKIYDAISQFVHKVPNFSENDLVFYLSEKVDINIYFLDNKYFETNYKIKLDINNEEQISDFNAIMFSKLDFKTKIELNKLEEEVRHLLGIREYNKCGKIIKFDKNI